MTVSRVGAVAAVLGGLLWIVAGVIGWGDEPINQPLYVAGLVLLVVAFAALGYALVATAPVWLRAVVTIATPALGLMVWLILRDSLSDYVAAVTGGALLLVGGGVALARSRPPAAGPAEPPPARGRRAAR
ncbi:MAG: hypothetical protein ACTHKG_05020 [Nocardioides sp.]